MSLVGSFSVGLLSEVGGLESRDCSLSAVEGGAGEDLREAMVVEETDRSWEGGVVEGEERDVEEVEDGVVEVVEGVEEDDELEADEGVSNSGGRVYRRDR